MLRLERVALESFDWGVLDQFSDRLIFQTPQWQAYVAETHDAEPVIAVLLDADQAVGYFTGLIVRKFGLRILGSPFPGWTTDYMGFNLAPGVDRAQAAKALQAFAFRELRCAHVELRDRHFGFADLDGLGFETEVFTTMEVDLSGTEDEVFGRMNSACRRAIRKAEKSGVTIEEATDEGFAAEYHAQLVDVFAKQGLRPTYDQARVEALMRHLLPTGNLLLLRARSAEGECIGTGVFPGLGQSVYFWGGASWRAHQILRPNETLFWHAMRHWKARGALVLDTSGGGEYKRKYGVTELQVPTFRRSRIPGLGVMRGVAQRVHSGQARLAGRRAG